MRLMRHEPAPMPRLNPQAVAAFQTHMPDDVRAQLATIFARLKARVPLGFAGLGADCTWENCSGPYTDSHSNYNYWFSRSQSLSPTGDPTIQSGDPINTAAIGMPNCVGYDYPALAKAYGVEDCASMDFATSLACYQRNAPIIAQIQQMAGSCILPSQLPSNYVPTPGSSWDVYLQGHTFAPPTVTYPLPGTTYNNTGGSSGAGQLTFSNSRNSTNLQVGDTWTVRITGAGANLPVAVVGVHDGVSSNAQMGMTDGAGTWSKSGTFDSSTVGNWQETWYVNGQSVGALVFTVSAGSQGSSSTPGTSGSGTPGGGTLQNLLGGGASDGTILGFPQKTFVLGAAGLLAVMMLMGGRR